MKNEGEVSRGKEAGGIHIRRCIRTPQSEKQVELGLKISLFSFSVLSHPAIFVCWVQIYISVYINRIYI